MKIQITAVIVLSYCSHISRSSRISCNWKLVCIQTLGYQENLRIFRVEGLPAWKANAKLQRPSLLPEVGKPWPRVFSTGCLDWPKLDPANSSLMFWSLRQVDSFNESIEDFYLCVTGQWTYRLWKIQGIGAYRTLAGRSGQQLPGPWEISDFHCHHSSSGFCTSSLWNS